MLSHKIVVCGMLAGFCLLAATTRPSHAQDYLYSPERYAREYTQQPQKEPYVSFGMKVTREEKAHRLETARTFAPWYLAARGLTYLFLLLFILTLTGTKSKQRVAEWWLARLRKDGFYDGKQPINTPLTSLRRMSPLIPEAWCLLGVVIILEVAAMILLHILPLLSPDEISMSPGVVDLARFVSRNEVAWKALAFIACFAYAVYLLDTQKIVRWMAQNGVNVRQQEGIVTAVQTKSTPEGTMYAPIIMVQEKEERESSPIRIELGGNHSARYMQRHNTPEQIHSQRWKFAPPKIGEKCLVTVDVLKPHETLVRWDDGEEIICKPDTQTLRNRSGNGYKVFIYAFLALVAFLVLATLKH